MTKYLFSLSFTNGETSQVGFGAKNCKVSPRRGRPREPGGSRPLAFGWLHLYAHVMKAITMAKVAAHTATQTSDSMAAEEARKEKVWLLLLPA